jgi:hypothetical protein
MRLARQGGVVDVEKGNECKEISAWCLCVMMGLEELFRWICFTECILQVEGVGMSTCTRHIYTAKILY